MNVWCWIFVCIYACHVFVYHCEATECEFGLWLGNRECFELVCFVVGCVLLNLVYGWD